MENGVQLCIHCIGDRANREVLDELVRQLFEKETLDKEQVAKIFDRITDQAYAEVTDPNRPVFVHTKDVVLNARSAAARGARIAVRTRLTGARRQGEKGLRPAMPECGQPGGLRHGPAPVRP